jgi:hypothetical protein
MVNTTDGFSVRRIEGDLPQCELLWRGEPTSVRVDGIVLEHQLQIGPGHLLFLTDDSPFEEGLHIYLLDRDMHVIDGLELGAPYAAGTLGDVTREGDTAVSFSFFGGDRWQLEVNEKPLGFLAARVSAPVRRKPGGRRRLRLHRVA